MPLFYNQTVAVLRPPEKTNRAGEKSLDYAGLDVAEGTPWLNVAVRPTSQQEVVGDDREAALSQWRLASQPGRGDVDVLHTDWVRLPTGEVCVVVGEVARPNDPISGRIDHVEVTVERNA